MGKPHHRLLAHEGRPYPCEAPVTYLIGLLLLALIGCAVTIYRLSGENRLAYSLLSEANLSLHYLRERNKALNAELLTMSVTTTTHGTSVPVKVLLPAPRKPKSIRGKRK
jgi:hypothetical protein